jgi:hypothetical protein
MKQIIFLFALLAFSSAVFAQAPKAEDHYWVVETNNFYRQHSIVKIYTSDDVLVHEVKLYGVHLDINRPKHKQKVIDIYVSYIRSISQVSSNTPRDSATYGVAMRKETTVPEENKQ